MAPATSAEEMVRFLTSCLKNSEPRKIDFEMVATECAIVTKAAAAKRYERHVKSQKAKSSGVRGKASTAKSIDGDESAGLSGDEFSHNSKRMDPRFTPKKKSVSPKKRKLVDDAAEPMICSGDEAVDDSI